MYLDRMFLAERPPAEPGHFGLLADYLTVWQPTKRLKISL
jgi:hypothetical protein